MGTVNLDDRVIISVAPVGQSAESFAVSPKSARQVAAETVACGRSGASVVHLHVRDDAGIQTDDLSTFSRTIDMIGDEVDIIVQGSTGGLSTLTLEERCVALNDPRVESASLNIGSINFGDTVYINTMPDARYWAKRIMEKSTKAELEIFDLGMFTAADALAREGLVPPPTVLALAFGFDWGLQPDRDVLEFAVARIPEGAIWGVLHHGMRDLDFMAHAIALGARFIRVGYEDSLVGPGGRTNLTNSQLVAAAVEAVLAIGRRPATSAEARQILGLATIQPRKEMP